MEVALKVVCRWVRVVWDIRQTGMVVVGSARMVASSPRRSGIPSKLTFKCLNPCQLYFWQQIFCLKCLPKKIKMLKVVHTQCAGRVQCFQSAPLFCEVMGLKVFRWYRHIGPV